MPIRNFILCQLIQW